MRNIKRISICLIVSIVSVLTVVSLIFFIFFKPVPVKIRSSVKPRSTYIGDDIKYTLTVMCGSRVQLELPEAADYPDGFEARAVIPSEKISLRKKTVKKIYVLTCYSTGTYTIPGLDVRYRQKGQDPWKTVRTEGATIEVRTLIKGELESDQQINIDGGMAGERTYGSGLTSRNGRGRSINAPIRYPINDTRPPKKIMTHKDMVLRVIFILAGMILAVFVLIMIVGTLKYEPEKESPPAHETALKKLEKLRSGRLLEKGLVKKFCSTLFSDMTDYARARFGLKMTAMTGREFISEIEKVKELTDEQKAFLKERISLYDRVRYSRHDQPPEELDPELKSEIRFIRETRTEDAPEEADA